MIEVETSAQFLGIDNRICLVADALDGDALVDEDLG